MHTLEVHGIWNEQTFYSDERELSFEWWLVLAESARQKGKKNLYNHAFGASTLLRRGAVGHLLQAMARKDFRDWTKPMGFEGSASTHNNYRVEMRQWSSGSALYSALLRGLTARLSKAAGCLVQVRDYTAYDDQLLQAVVQCNASSPVAPAFAYHASCWHQPVAGNAKVVNQDNLLTACRDAVRTRIAEGTYARVVLDKAKFGPEPSAAATVAGSRVASKPEDYELCYPKDSELPIKQTTMTVGATLGSVTVLDPINPDRSWSWETLVSAHNAEFNPSGAAWNPQHPNKRGADGPGLSSGPLVELTSQVADFDPAKMSKVVPSAGQFDLFVDADGGLFLHALQDADLLADHKLFKVLGNFLVGAPAQAFMSKTGAQFVSYCLTPQSRVFLTLKPTESSSSGPELQLPTSPVTLEAAYDLLALKKVGRVELLKHTVTYQPGGNEPMVVKADEDCCLQMTAMVAVPGEEVPFDKLSSAVSLQGLSAVEVIHQLQFDPQLKRLKPMLPVVVPITAFQIKAGTHYRL